MQRSDIVEKCIDISKLSIKDMMARRVFILADGNRTLAQIFDLCMIQTDKGLSLAEVLVDNGFIRRSSKKLPARTSMHRKNSTEEQAYDSFIADITSELAKYLGPVAPIIISDVISQSKIGGKVDHRLIIELASKKIDATDDRSKFIKNFNRLTT